MKSTLLLSRSIVIISTAFLPLIIKTAVYYRGSGIHDVGIARCNGILIIQWVHKSLISYFYNPLKDTYL